MACPVIGVALGIVGGDRRRADRDARPNVIDRGQQLGPRGTSSHGISVRSPVARVERIEVEVHWTSGAPAALAIASTSAPGLDACAAMRMHDASSRRRSRGSTSRVPSMSICDSGTGTKPGTWRVSSFQQCPVSIATAIPSRNPPTVVSGVLKSACASNQHTAGESPRIVRTPAVTPTATLQFPESTRGKASLASALDTALATARWSSNAMRISEGNRAADGSMVRCATSSPSVSSCVAIPSSSRCAGPRPIRTSRSPESNGTRMSSTRTDSPGCRAPDDAAAHRARQGSSTRSPDARIPPRDSRRGIGGPGLARLIPARTS